MTPLIVAELSANHAHSLEIAEKSLIVLKNIGVGAAKLQTYTPDCLTLPLDEPPFIIKARFGISKACMRFIRKPPCP